MFLRKLLTLLFIFSCFSFVSNAQINEPYNNSWQKIEDLQTKGLTKSALQKVMSIYAKALKENNEPQQLKACLSIIKFRSEITENSNENNIFYIDTLVQNAKAPTKNMLQSIQAEMVWEYLQRYRWKFYNRTKLQQEASKDITSWSIDKLNNTITTLYKASLLNEDILKNTKIENYDSIIIKGENTRQLRPTLFDFLTHRALAFFTSGENDITKPENEFTLTDNKVFAPVNEFINATFTTPDITSLQYTALLLFQNILKFHLNDINNNALIDADILRLQFVNQYAVNENKILLYEAALKNIADKYTGNATAQAMYLRAEIYKENGDKFNPLTKIDNQFEIKKARLLCDTVIKKFPESEGAINCKNLLANITQPSLQIETEKVNIPNQAFRSLVTYRNIKKIYLRVIQTSKNEIDNIDTLQRHDQFEYLINKKINKSWSVSLPDTQDYQAHAVEIKIDELPVGTYFILASIDEKFSLEKNIVAKQMVYVSNISYVNNKNEYYVLNRDNGQPLANTKVQVWETTYNYKTQKNETTQQSEKYITNKNGFFKLKQTEDYHDLTLQFITTTDELFIKERQYQNAYNNSNDEDVNETKLTTFLFTDRSIYRPGQTVYFKGIVTKKRTKDINSTIAPAFKTKVFLADANNQKIASLELITNEYGSYHGSFKLPEGTLNGQFSLTDDSTNSIDDFSVEEYKRPTFAVTIQKPIGTYRLNDSIKITGIATANSGNNIDGATIKYNIIRNINYPYWYYGYRNQRTVDKQITNGTAITNKNGEFTITFKASPDEHVDKNTTPIFNYEISADVTDINGETRTGTTEVAVAYNALKLNIEVGNSINIDSLKNIMVRSTNLNNIDEKTTAILTIQKLKSPDKIFRDRYWKQPDQFIMTKEDYYHYFPYDVYKDENNVKNYSIAEKVFENIDSTNSKIKNIPLTLKQGWYKIVATTKDKFGVEVRDEKYVELTDNNLQQTNNLTPISIDINKTSAEPGQKIKYKITTGFDNIWLIHTLTRMNDNSITTFKNIKKISSFNEDIIAKESDRGGIGMSYIFVKHNRVITGQANFDIPWSNKELTIDYTTFRDKLLPGSKEKWSVKISGNKSEKVAAEMLVTMYDASLDQFEKQSWSRLNVWPIANNYINWNKNFFEQTRSENEESYINNYEPYNKTYDRVIDYRFYNERDIMVKRDLTGSISGVVVAGLSAKITIRGSSSLNQSNPLYIIDGIIQPNNNLKPEDIENIEVLNSANAITIYGATGANGAMIITTKNGKLLQKNPPLEDVKLRKNFNETAFFFPDLQTDKNGAISFNFTMPDALTKWKLMTFAHTKDLASGYVEKNIVTQKTLMVQPNAPRFIREGDEIIFSAKVANLSQKQLSGTTSFALFDAATNLPVDIIFKNNQPTQSFTVAAAQSTVVNFSIKIPINFNSALTFKIVAKAGDYSDGEEMSIPILSNRMLVTESMPINLRNTNKKNFKFDKLINSGSSNTITNHAVTVEYTANPAWYAVQALPYLMEFPYECAEQTFNRFYANALATYITTATPKIKAVFDKWKNIDTAALQSNLEKNEELKTVLLQETPWVLDAKNEDLQKKNIALLFDMVKMSAEKDKAINKLKDMQSSDGGFVWFKGGYDDRYITQYILTGIGHLKKLTALQNDDSQKLKSITENGISYLDNELKNEYANLIKNKISLTDNNLSNITIQYLYMRSFFNEYKIPAASQTAYSYYREQAQKYWLSNSKYMQAMIALALYRTNDNKTPHEIIKSLKENAISNEELGMYWKEFSTGGYYWHQAPIESEALMIEAFTDIDKNPSTINDLKTWLIKQKQTQNWKTTKATADACYALLFNNNNLLNEEKLVTINIGSTIIKSTDEATEAGTGYFKKTILGEAVKPAMGNISVAIDPINNMPMQSATSYGSVYWQYFEEIDKITAAETPLQLSKQLFIEKNTNSGKELVAIKDNATLKIGDKITVRIALKVDRDMEYVHMKDMRAACMEPINVISEYKWQDGLGYYQSTKDASTNFFFSQIQKGSYIFEYQLFVTTAGNFSNGITTIQCMYAPEFTSHSEGIRVNVKNN